MSDHAERNDDDDETTEAQRRDPDAPGAFIDDDEVEEMPEPNEPA
jgi:hypothetical protein